jgi:hypothetical protein
MTNWQRVKHSRKIVQEDTRRHKVVSTSQQKIFKSSVMRNIFLTGATKKKINLQATFLLLTVSSKQFNDTV